MIAEVTLKNILSFKQTEPLELTNLSVLIGPNGSGKSNFIEIFRLLQASPRDLTEAIRAAGGVDTWIWKGPQVGPADVRVVIQHSGDEFKYTLKLRHDSRIEERLTGPPKGPEDWEGFHRYFSGRVSGAGRRVLFGEGVRKLKPDAFDPERSLLSQIRNPVQYPTITRVAGLFDRIRLYSEWRMGQSAPARQPQPVDMEKASLREDAANLALVLNRMELDGSLGKVEKYLARFLPSYKRLSFQIEGRSIRLFLAERHFDELIPPTRISDGTLRFLCLMAVLCDPTPPPLICIDEPEVGLHPEAVQLVAEALKDASSRTQLIIATHSEALVDEFSDAAESVVVCERDFDGASRFRRLSPAKLKLWLKDYRLGELWRKGELGGTLW